MSWNSLDSKISRHSRHSMNSLSCCRATICTLGCGQGAPGVEEGLGEGTVAAGCGEIEPGLLGTVLITSSRWSAMPSTPHGEFPLIVALLFPLSSGQDLQLQMKAGRRELLASRRHGRCLGNRLGIIHRKVGGQVGISSSGALRHGENAGASCVIHAHAEDL